MFPERSEMFPELVAEAEWLLQSTDALWDPPPTFALRARLLSKYVQAILHTTPRGHVYVETSHLFIKLFADVAWSVAN
jgi:hypothetical protein